MLRLTEVLPAPVNKYVEVKKQEVSKPKAKKVYNIPPYGQRENYVPRTLEDFGDGGAFPEILILQYPLDMGRSDRAGDTRVVTVATDEDGVPDFQKNLLNQGSNKQMIVHTKVSSLIGSSAEDDDLARPSDEAIAALTQKTREAMEKKVNRKIAYALPGKLPEGSLPGDVKPAEFYKYTPVEPLTGRVLDQRVIHMVEVEQDPLDPPKFRHLKVPAAFNDDPVPILHSPPRKVTVQDQQDWKIPPCISNWKNARGYTIPLDKRLAADGRGLQQTVVNDRFATFAEALQVAESKMREEVELRNSIVRQQKEKERLSQEEMLRRRALEVRQQHEDRHRIESASENPEEREARRERDRQREKLRREAERDLRRRAQGRRTQEERERERDISEKIALGQAAVASNSGVTFDSRLFDQSGGMGSGMAADDEYNVYTKPLFMDKMETRYRVDEAETMCTRSRCLWTRWRRGIAWMRPRR